MNIKVVSDETRPQPKVGELWKYSDGEAIWMRINGEKIKRAFPHAPESVFFSVCLTTDSNYRAGDIAYSSGCLKMGVLKQLNTLEVAPV